MTTYRPGTHPLLVTALEAARAAVVAQHEVERLAKIARQTWAAYKVATQEGTR